MEEFAQLLLLLAVLGLAIAYAQDGPEGMFSWLRIKVVGEPA